MIDIHCHLLPDIDDGPETLEESLELSELLAREGITTVAATPHVFDARYPTPTSDQILSRLERIGERVPGRLRVVCGAEVRLVPEVMTVLNRKEIFINQGRYMLIEFPSNLIPHGIERLLFGLTSSGITPIIAHPERNRDFLRDPEQLSAFITMGCYAHLDAPSLLEDGRSHQAALRWIEAGLIHCVASDSHRCHWRPPRLAEAYRRVEKHCGAEVARALFVENPGAVIDSEALPFVPDVKSPKKSLLGWWPRAGQNK